MKKDLISVTDLNREEILLLFRLARKLKTGEKSGTPLKGRVLAMIFEKPSLRTRVTFETGIFQLGGSGIYLGPSDIQLGKRESVKDVAQNLSRWVDIIMARVFDHKTVSDLARYSSVPVINGLSDYEHPCQALGDFLTIYEHNKKLKGLTLVWIGDGNNVCNSLLFTAAILGVNMAVATPNGYEPKKEVVDKVVAQGRDRFFFTNNPEVAVKNADFIYTDVWASMGQEAEVAKRKEIFKDFQVNSALLHSAPRHCRVMHCLPAHRGEEITDEVMDGPQSIILDQAENRLHIQKAIMLKLLKKG